jgi:diguanylate cyclase (GGDEF)-like protein/PAS domain S-box-containing protein
MLALFICGSALQIYNSVSANSTVLATSAFCISLALATLAIMIWPALRRNEIPLQRLASLAGPQQPVHTATAALALQARHELAERIAHVGHWRFDVSANRIEWSSEMYSIFGVTPLDYRPALDTIIDFICPDDRPAFARSFQRAIENGESFETAVKLRLAGAVVRYATVRGIPEREGSGKITAIFGVFVDVTGHKELEEALHEANRAGALANRALQELAMQDALTGLPNRRAFDTALATEFKRAARDKRPLGLIMIDLDHFKSFNDKYGHPAGDNCLRRAAEAIAGVPQRPADLTARYGGEEIVVLLPNTDERGSAAVAQLIVQAVRDMRLLHESNPAGIVTVSCGVAAFTPDEDAQVQMMLLERADQALYRAKIYGRNRVASHIDLAGTGEVGANGKML